MNARQITKIVTFVAAAIIFTGVAVHASSVESLELEALADEAYEIARVKVQSKKASSLNGFPHWAVDVAVLESYKGELYDDDELTMFVPGGADGDREVLISGIADLEVGGEYIVFLGDDEEMQWTALVVMTDAVSGERFVARANEMKGPVGAGHDHAHDHDHGHGQGHAALSAASSLMRYDEAVQRLLEVE